MPLIRTQDPAVEPVTLAEAKANLYLDSDLTADDPLITALITGAREYAESYCGRSFITQKWRLVLDAFPGRGSMGLGGTSYGSSFSLTANGVQFERGPVQSVDSIAYYDMSGTLQTVTAPAHPQYAIDLTGVGRMTPGFGQIWPIPQPRIGAVQINYTAGYGDTSASVPAGIKNWIKLRVATMYANREEIAVTGRGKVAPLPFVDDLLNPFCIVMA